MVKKKNKAAVLLKNEGLYYLGILKKGKTALFATGKKDNLMYKNVTPAAGRLILANLAFKTLAGKGFKGEFKEKYSDMGTRDPQQAIKCLQKIIRDRYIHKYPLLKEVSNKEFADKHKFDKEVREILLQSYVCEFQGVDWREIEQYTERGELYLFQIFSKDFASGRTGRKNQQTFYWEALFETESPHQLNGGGEIFYRKQAIKEKAIKKGYEKKPWVVVSKRFTHEDGLFSFHCPIKLSYKEPSQSEARFAVPFVNKYVNEELPERSDLHFLGIDRGEKHLAYYSLINSNSEIISQGSLNLPFTDKEGNFRTVKAKKRTLDNDGKEHEEEVDCKDYNDLLEARGGDRDYARKNWQTIGTIKELKQGYLSQVVHEIAKLAVFEAKGPTFIVLENLNAGFMRGRQKIEKAIYQQFEVALAKKLGFLVDKSKDGKSGEVGSVTKAYQLTPTVKNFEDIKNRGQAGIMLFTRPDYTSKTDPVTGWRRHRQVRIGSGSAEKIRENILHAFSEIGFDGQDFFFTYTDSTTNKQWTIWSGKNGVAHDRYYRIRNEHGIWEAKKHPLMEMLNELFTNFDKQRSIREQISEKTEPQKVNKHTAWESLRFVINLIMEMRNSNGGNDRDADFILSPVRDENDNHFDSRVYWDQERWEGGVMRSQPAKLPSSGDASGAYNIARKGAIMNEHIKQGWKLYIRDEEWDAWLLGRQAWDRWIKKNKQSLRKQ